MHIRQQGGGQQAGSRLDNIVLVSHSYLRKYYTGAVGRTFEVVRL